ncbi:MAG: septal ring lytic transglycosylase RlpA family protein [Pseudomonadota bacterium]
MAEPTERSMPTPSRDPAISAGGFDARAAAAQIAAERAGQGGEQRMYQTAAGAADFSANTAVSPTIGKPATTEKPVSGEVFHPAANPGYDRTGVAGIVDGGLRGQPTANGETYDPAALSAAHPSLPLPSLIHVINTDTGRETVLRVNDRGPFDGGGLIEVSDAAAQILSFNESGRANVRVKYLGPAPVAPGDQSPSPVVASRPDTAEGTASSSKSEPNRTAAPFGLPSAPSRAAPVRTVFPGSQLENFFVQLGSFSNIANAERLHAQLGPLANIEIVPVRVRGADFFRVVAGPLKGRNAAIALRDDLANQGVADGLVISDPS